LRRRLSTGLPQYYSFISMILILYTFTGEKQYRMKNLRNFAKKPQKTRKKVMISQQNARRKSPCADGKTVVKSNTSSVDII
jgi:hypothetical protein